MSDHCSMTVAGPSITQDGLSVPESTNDVRLSITPDLYEALSGLVRYSAQVELPVVLGQAVQVFLTSYEQANEKHEARSEDDPSLKTDDGDVAVATATPDDVPPKQPGVPSKEIYMPRSIIVQVAQFARSRKATRAIERAGLDVRRYSLIALCAGTRTYTTAAQERLIKADPDAASHFLPSHLAHPPSSSVSAKRSKSGPSSSLGAEYRSASKEISTVLNVLFSIGGVGGAVFVVAKTSAGMRQETAVLLAFLAAVVVGIAETWLYISHARRSAKRYAEGEEIRRAIEKQAGPSLPDLLVEKVVEEVKEGVTELKVTGGDVGLDDTARKTDDTAGSTVFDSGLNRVQQTSREDPISRHSEIRLRRKPLNSTSV
ncbi:hypothetical protein QFC21_003034 [Naganishia friedmannii]|uniref:Uncharacterized protein n=1 Tax=Naganishia friedmannii TaxID=89922 RepID=A0ACC2VSS7_9TREE|nr:hypothetical protein QFC21_003034 [Naganishia friedmannii]